MARIHWSCKVIQTGAMPCAARSASRCCRWTGYEGKIRIPYGTLIDEPTLKPMAHIFVGSKASWYEILDDLPQYDESPWA